MPEGFTQTSMTDRDAQMIRTLCKRWGFGAILRELTRMAASYAQQHPAKWGGVKKGLQKATYHFNVRGNVAPYSGEV